MIPKKPAPDLIRGAQRFSVKIMAPPKKISYPRRRTPGLRPAFSFPPRLNFGKSVRLGATAGEGDARIGRRIALPRSEHHYHRVDLDPIEQVDCILVGQADATRRDRRA